MAKPTSVGEYLNGLSDERREALATLRKVINKNIDKRFEEGIQYGQVAWFVPHSLYPAGYHCNPKEPLPFASIASMKGHIGLYLFCVYLNEELQNWFVDAWKATGKKLDMGKSCVRVKRIEDVPLDVVAQLFKKIKAKDFIAVYEEMRDAGSKRSPKKSSTQKKQKKAKKATNKKPASKKKAAKRKASKNPASKKGSRKTAKKKSGRS